MEDKLLINEVYSKLKNHLKAVSKIDADLVICPVDVCHQCRIPKLNCENQLEKLFPGTYNGRLSEILMQLIEFHRQSKDNIVNLDNSSIKMLNDLDLFLDKVREFNEISSKS